MRITLLLFTIFFLFGCTNINKVLKSKDAGYKLRMAEQYYAKKKFTIAQQLYEDVIPYYRGTPEFEDIYYKYAYTAYYMKDYLNAENLFRTYLEAFPKSVRAEEIDYMRAYTFFKQSPKAELDQTNTIKAIGEMQKFIDTHPGSTRIKEATEIIDISRKKLEIKDSKAAQLYFDLGQFRAASVAYNSLLTTYPDSERTDEYKFAAIKSFYQFAELSIEEKKTERFEQVIVESTDFLDRFPQSGFAREVQQYLSLSQNHLKSISNEPSKTPA